MTEASKTTAIDGYVRFFETLTPDTLDRLAEHVTPDIRFKDPFNDVSGPAAMRAIFQHMFEVVEQPVFQVTHRAQDREHASVWFLRWRLTGRLRSLSRRNWDITGMSEIHVAADGRVSAHVDHWDAGRQFYELLPVIGPVIRILRRRAGRN